MVLGHGDQAARALRREATAPCTALVRGGATLEQPIASDDVLDAILNGLDRPELDDIALDLAGPESLTHRALVERAAKILGTRVRVIPIPYFMAHFVAMIAEFLLADPPMTPAMLGVLDQDDDIDSSEACRLLGIEQTSLDEMLTRSLSIDGPIP
jgi:NADH dehydrogenase